MPMHMQTQASPNVAIAAASPRYEVRAEPLTVELPVTPPARAAFSRIRAARAAVADPIAQPGLQLAIEDVGYEEGASGFVAVYLNASGADAEGGDGSRGQFLGTIAVFGGQAHEAIPAKKGQAVATPHDADAHPTAGSSLPPTRITRVFDVSAPILEADAPAVQGDQPSPPLRVTLVRQPLDADEIAEDDAQKGKVTFSRVSLRAIE
jgi:hypothetical protein